MQQQRGFTLIELIIVIVILGVLAVTAAPKFIDIQSDARAATLNGVRAALQGGAQLVYARSALAGVQANPATDPVDATSRVTVAGLNVATNFGYPSAVSITAIRNNPVLASDVAAFAELDAADWTFAAGSADADTPAVGRFGISPRNTAVNYLITDIDGASCHVLYTDAVNQNTPAVVTVVTGGC